MEVRFRERLGTHGFLFIILMIEKRPNQPHSAYRLARPSPNGENSLEAVSPKIAIDHSGC